MLHHLLLFAKHHSEVGVKPIEILHRCRDRKPKYEGTASQEVGFVQQSFYFGTGQHVTT